MAPGFNNSLHALVNPRKTGISQGYRRPGRRIKNVLATGGGSGLVYSVQRRPAPALRFDRAKGVCVQYGF